MRQKSQLIVYNKLLSSTLRLSRQSHGGVVLRIMMTRSGAKKVAGSLLNASAPSSTLSRFSKGEQGRQTVAYEE